MKKLSVQVFLIESKVDLNKRKPKLLAAGNTFHNCSSPCGSEVEHSLGKGEVTSSSLVKGNFKAQDKQNKFNMGRWPSG